MKYKTSFFNKAIIFEDLKRLWGVALLYLLILFFLGPLQIMLVLGDNDPNDEFLIRRFLDINRMETQVVLSIIFSIALAMLVFKYLHQNKSATVMHSFPITRKQLFHSHNITGFMLVFIPVIMNALILIGIMFAYNDGSKLFKEIYTMRNIGVWSGTTILINIIIYLISTFVAMITGTTLIQGILSLIFIFLPVGLGYLIIWNLDQLLYGFTENKNVTQLMIDASPVTFVMDGKEFSPGLILWYIILGVILYAVAYYFYQNRHLERASDPIAFDILKPVFKYGVTFCAMVLAGAYFYSLKRTDLWLYIGYAVGGYLGYMIAEMIIQKTIWVFKNIKGFILYTMVVVILFVGIKLDMFGYERRVPDIDHIEHAYYGYGLYSYLGGNQQGLEKLENIKRVREFHKEVIQHKKQFKNIKTGRYNHRNIGIAYQLKNGRTLLREYIVPNDFIENNRYIKGIYESTEYKTQYYEIFRIDSTKIEYVEIDPFAPVNRNVKIVDDAEISEMIGIIKEDILNETYEQYTRDIQPWATIRLRYREDSDFMERQKVIHIRWKKSYDKLSAWMKQKGYYERARVTLDDIAYVTIEKINENMEINETYKTIDMEESSQNTDRTKIRNKEEIEYLLTNCVSDYRGNGGYIVRFYLNNGNRFSGEIDEQKAPKQIKEYFK